MTNAPSDETRSLETSRLHHTGELFEAEDLLRIATDNAHVGLVVINRDRRYLYANPAHAEILGLPLSDIVGRNVPDVLGENYEKGIRFLMDRAFAGDRITFELPWPSPSGTRYFDVTYAPRTVNGVVEQVVAVTKDITDCKRAEAALKLSEFSVQHASLPTYWIARDSRICRVNRATCELLGYTEAELLNMAITDLDPDFTAERWPAHWRELRERQRMCFETRQRHKDGHIIPIEVDLNWFEFEGQEYNFAFVRDITDRKRAEEARRQSDARFAKAFRFNPAAMCISTMRDGRFIEVNERYCQLFGFTREEFIGRTAVELRMWADSAERAALVSRLPARNFIREYETQFRRKDGALIDALISMEPIEWSGEPEPVMITMFTDITERKRVEVELRLNKTILEETGHIAKVGGWSFDAITGEGFWTDEVAHIHDLDPALPISKDIGLKYFIGESRDKIGEAVKNAVEQGTPYDLELEILSAKGVRKWVRTIGHPVKENGRVVRVHGSFQDITDRKKAEDARRASVARYRALFDNAPDGILIGDAEGYYLDANASMCRMLGYTQAEMVGMHATDIIAPAETKGVEPVLNEIRGGAEHHREWTFRRKDGSLFPVELIATQMPDGNLLGMVRDITERKSLEQQFLRAQRLESIGTLASGVAHDLNNILAPIMMSVPVLRMEMSAADREGIITTIEMSAERGAQIVKQVLTFGRGITGEKRPLDVGVLIREMVKIMRGTFPKNITVEHAVSADLWRVNGDATHIHQVLLNLCVNARDAMSGGGRLRLSARNLEVDASYASMVPGASPGTHVLIKVSDTGTGIPPEIIGRIFDPFFTTKGVGEGTGLGLSTVHGIVRSHGGFIRVESTPGRGTAFRIHLPAVTETDTSPDAVLPASPPRGHGELVLVVDDEATITNSARTVLEIHGYRVKVAADGTEALAVFAQSLGGIAVVLTDLMMPVMDGMALIRALRKMQPDLPVIASTGLDDKIRAAELKALHIRTVLKKPYGADTLRHTIHEALHPEADAARSAP